MQRYLLIKLHLILVIFSYANAQSPQDGWRFTYTGDNFTEDAMLDLSYLNEDIAGENGFIRLSPDGSYFVNNQGEIRFWAINGGELVRGHDPNLSDADLETYAKFLAKMGVNMIRFHGQIFSTTQDINQPNTQEADYIWRLVAAMKEQGIYTTISPFWPAHLDNIPQNWGLGDYWGDKDPWGLIYFDQTFRNAYKNWVEYLYTEVNPHTGIPLKDDPAVAIIQILNEDGVFFWTIGGVEPSLMTEMQQQFFYWSVSEYGTIEDALNTWENTSLPSDNINQGLLEIINIWFATDDPNVPTPTPGFEKRLSDQMNFFADVQRDVYREIYDHYRSIGCPQLINATNWKTASPNRLFDLERWTNLATDVLAVNRYYSPLHVGENSGWRIERGHHFEGNSVLFYPHKLPINIKQVENMPFLVTESGWNLPHKYQAEGPFLISAYMSLTGVDAFYWFSPSAITYEDDPYWPYWGEINGELPMFRWTCSIPGQVGMFPANALAFRKGYIRKGNAVLHEERTFQSLVDREMPLISEENSFDPNRDTYNPNPEQGETEYSPLTYLAGPVEVVYEGDPSNNAVLPNLNELVNIGEKKITSITGELSWDYEQGICVLDAPRVQGICGFPRDEPYQLSDVTITSKNAYSVVNVVSMDELPLSESEKILIQVGTVYRPAGWEEVPTSFSPGEGTPEIDGFRIESLGRMPWMGANTMVKIDIKNTRVKSAWLLDEAGYEDQEFFVTDTGDGISMWLPISTMYVILDTRPASVPSGLQDKDNDFIIIYPNPTYGNFNIKLSDEYHETGISELKVMDIFGKTIKTYNYNEKNNYCLNVPAGTYFFKLQTKEGEEKIKRIIIQ